VSWRDHLAPDRIHGRFLFTGFAEPAQHPTPAVSIAPRTSAPDTISMCRPLPHGPFGPAPHGQQSDGLVGELEHAGRDASSVLSPAVSLGRRRYAPAPAGSMVPPIPARRQLSERSRWQALGQLAGQ
jgi:hypothetical protein